MMSCWQARLLFPIMWWKAVARIGLVLGSVALLSTWVFMAVDLDGYLGFIEQRLSADGNLLLRTAAVLRIQVILIASVAFLAYAVSSWGAPLQDDLSRLRLGPVDWAAYSLALIMFVVAVVVRPSRPYTELAERLLFEEDGLFENLTAIFAVAAAVILISVAVRGARDRASTAVLCGVGALSFLYGMEEISWGQRIFDWHTPERLAEINAQRETNVHNIFEEYLPIAATAFAMALGIAILLRGSWVNLCRRVTSLNSLEGLVPSRGLILFGFLFFFGSTLPLRHPPIPRDFLEYCVSVFALAYAVSLVRAKRVGESGRTALDGAALGSRAD